MIGRCSPSFIPLFITSFITLLGVAVVGGCASGVDGDLPFPIEGEGEPIVVVDVKDLTVSVRPGDPALRFRLPITLDPAVAPFVEVEVGRGSCQLALGPDTNATDVDTADYFAFAAGDVGTIGVGPALHIGILPLDGALDVSDVDLQLRLHADAGGSFGALEPQVDR